MMTEDDHQKHASVLAGNSKKVQVFPRPLCQTVLEGIAAQKMVDRTKLKWREMFPFDEVKQIASLAEEFCLRDVEVGDTDDLYDEADKIVAFDDVPGESLYPELVRKARSEELDYVKAMGVYEVVPLAECMAETKRAPITTKWIDVNKGDTNSPPITEADW